MALAPPPDGLRPAAAADFAAPPDVAARLLVAAVVAASAVATVTALRRWGPAGPGVVAVVAGLTAALGLLLARWVCFRRDEPVVVELAEARAEETDRGRLAIWRFGPPVPPRLAQLELESEHALAAEPGDRVPARVRVSGLGGLRLVLGTLTPAGWRLPAPVPKWPVAAQLGAVVGTVAGLVLLTLAAAPSRPLVGVIVSAEQEPWELGEGTLPWHLVVDVPEARGGRRRITAQLAHERFLRLLPERGQAALARPGLLPAGERALLLARYVPIGRRVTVFETRLGRLEKLVYRGP